MTPKWFFCGCCYAQRLEEPPHGDDPCPLKVREVEAHIALMEAQRLSQELSSFAMNDMSSVTTKIMKMMGGGDENDS